MQNDTIAAIATPQGVGGVGVIRVSGGDSFQLVAPLLRRPGKESIPPIPPTHHLTYRVVTDPQTQEVLDEVLVAFMRAPHTYTCEDVVEIQGHGGPLILRRILRAVLRQGARLANPGEFTLRAFLNGRLDLAQAEAVMDLIGSQTEAGQRLAVQQLRGKLSEQVQQARTSVLGAVARIEVSIDFPEDDVPTPLSEELQPFIIEARQQVDKLLAGSDQGRLYRQGVRTAIIGRPNVGKSSLLNALLRMERAIVTPIAGTTRDTVEEVANLRGVPLHLIDTAGMTPTEDPVERIGVERSRAAAENADIILHVFDGSAPLTEQDWQVLEELRGMGYGKQGARPVIAVLNKSDCEQVIMPATLAELWPGAPVVATSTLTETGLEEVESTLTELVQAGSVMSNESVLITSARHQEALRRGREHLEAALASLEQEVPLDFVSIDLRAAYDALGEITGETASEDLLDRIFSEFCIGK